MKPLFLRRTTAAVCTAALLCSFLTGCDEIFQPVDDPEATDSTNPYMHWTDPVQETTTATEPTEPEEEGELGYVTGKLLNIRSGPGTDFDILGTLHLGNEVRILEQRAVDGALWGLTDIGWVSMEYVSFDFTATPTVTGTVTAKTLNVRSGAGTGYDVVGTLKKGDQIQILEQTTAGGKTWGRTTLGWVSLEYVSVTEVAAGTKIGIVDNKYLNVRSGPGFSYGTIDTLSANDEVYITEEVEADGMIWGNIGNGWVSMDYIKITGTVTQDPEQEEPVETTPSPVLDTSIVGSWVCMDEDSYFSGSTPSPSSYTFREDGTYSMTTAEYTYMDNIGWQGSGRTSTTQGTYSFDGRNLTITASGTDTTLSVSITDNTMEVYGHRTYSMMLRTYDVNALIKALIRRDRGSSAAAIQGSWTGIDRSTYTKDTSLDASTWYFGTDGSFSQSVAAYAYQADTGWVISSGSTIYSGVYFFDGSRLTLCYETRTDGTNWETDSDIRYVILENVSVGSSTLEMKDINLYLMKNAKIADVAAALG